MGGAELLSLLRSAEGTAAIEHALSVRGGQQLIGSERANVVSTAVRELTQPLLKSHGVANLLDVAQSLTTAAVKARGNDQQDIRSIVGDINSILKGETDQRDSNNSFPDHHEDAHEHYDMFGPEDQDHDL